MCIGFVTRRSCQAKRRGSASTNSARDGGASLGETLVDGHPGHALYPPLDVRDADEMVDKTRFSAFIQGSSDLHQRLAARGIDTVIVTGTVTNVGCESTARDGMMHDYKVSIFSECCRSPSLQQGERSWGGLRSNSGSGYD
nr:isochorismatase family cysteine hydrolase [Pandoraea sp. NE5]